MMRRVVFIFLLFTILLNFSSFSSIDYAYSTEGKNGKDDNAKSSGDSHEDSDKNKIFDDLDEELETKTAEYETDIIALLKVPAEQVEDEVKELKEILGEFEVDDTYSIISGFSGKLSKEQILAMAALDVTVQVEPDAKVQAFLSTATSWFGVQKARTDFSVDGNADANPATYSKDDIVIAVIDTGIDPKHMDLNSGKIIAWKDFINSKTTPYDDNGHGTHVASIAAGEGEANVAFTGVAPRAALVGVKVLNSAGSGSISGVISGVNWVVNNKALYGIEIMNLSLGTSGCSSGTDSLSLAVNNAVSNGIISVVAAGNSGPRTCTIGSPAAAENAITVGAMSDVGERGYALASFSSRGPTLDGKIKPDVVAPGVSITAAAKGTTSGYTTKSGTSMATPFIAGVAALMLDANPTLTPSIVKSKISTAIDWGPTGADIDYGSGRLDGYEAVRNAFATPPSGTNIAVPTHSFISDSLEGTGVVDTWSINVVNAVYPIAIVMIMPTWTSSSSPDFDMMLFNPSGSLIASSLGVTRQETIGVSISTTGTYTLQVKSFTGSGPYFLDISSGSTLPPPPTPDTTAPTVSITSPTNGAVVSGTITISASATDNVGVTSVDFLIDNTLLGTDTAAPYSISWDTRTVANALHSITATARDAANNAGSHTISVTVGNDIQPPTAPSLLTATAVSSSQINLGWTASTDNVGVTGYQVFRDNAQVATVTGTSYSDTGRSPSTIYNYFIKAFDATGNLSPPSTTVTATTPAPPPVTLSITVSAPSSQERGETFDVKATITNTGSLTAQGVQATILLPSGLSTTDPLTRAIGNITPGASVTVEWAVQTDIAGSYTISVTAVDSSGSSAQGSTGVTITASSSD